MFSEVTPLRRRLVRTPVLSYAKGSIWNFVRKSWPSVHLPHFFTGLLFSFTHILYCSFCCFWKRLKERSLNSGKEIVTCAVPPFNKPFWVIAISMWNMYIGIMKLFWWEQWASVSVTCLCPCLAVLWLFFYFVIQFLIKVPLIITWKDLVSTYFNVIDVLFYRGGFEIFLYFA